jgi:hypothetical protein
MAKYHRLGLGWNEEVDDMPKGGCIKTLYTANYIYILVQNIFTPILHR